MGYEINSECFFDNILDIFLLQVLELVLFEEQTDPGTMAKR
jgi:hypothetical protein